MHLTRDLILGAEDLPSECVHVEDWGGNVWVRALMGYERDALEQIITERQSDGRNNLMGLKAELVVRSARTEDGKLMFKPEDAGELNKKSAAAIDQIFNVAQRLSGFMDADVKELAKNSEAAQSGVSG